MADYTPTTEDIREAHAVHGAWRDVPTRSRAASDAAFDRWYAAEIARAKTEALREAADEVRTEARWQTECWLRRKPLPEPVGRLLAVEKILRDRAERIEAGS